MITLALLRVAVALPRKPSRAFARWRGMWCEPGITSRRGQDKSRKVRPVGRVRRCSNASSAANIASNGLNLRFLATGHHASAFGKLCLT